LHSIWPFDVIPRPRLRGGKLRREFSVFKPFRMPAYECGHDKLNHFDFEIGSNQLVLHMPLKPETMIISRQVVGTGTSVL
jgi:hypothetical protein